MRRLTWFKPLLFAIGPLFLAAHPLESRPPWPATPPPAVLVTPDGRGAYPNIQSAISAAGDGGVIELGSGAFFGPGNRDLDLSGKRLTIRSRSGDPQACVIDCGGSPADPHRGFIIDNGRGTDCTLEGLSVRNGWGDMGGAILCDGTSCLIRNCIFAGNTSGGGGAICCRNRASLRLIDCTFRQNMSTGSGGALRCDTSTLFASGCTFYHNRAAGSGGGLYTCVSGTSVIAAVPLPWSDEELLRPRPGTPVVLQSCTFAGNQSGKRGGAVQCNFSSPRFEKCVIAFNTPPEGVTHSSFAYPEFTDCCIYENRGQDPGGFLEHQIGINGNFCADPMLCDRDENATDFGILPQSPCAPGNGFDTIIGAWPVHPGERRMRILSPPRTQVRPPSPELVAKRQRLWDLRPEYIRLRNLGWTAEIAGDFLEAESCFREVLALLQHAVGSDHPLTAEATEDLAYLLSERGNLGEADLLYGAAQECWRKAPDRSQRLADNLVELAAVRSAQSRAAEAEKLLIEASEMRARLPGVLPVERANDFRKLGELLVADGRLDEGERMLSKAVSLQSNLPTNRNNTDLALALRSLARCCRLRGDPTRARSQLREALDLQRARFPSDHPQVARTLVSIADCCLEMDRCAEAESLYVEAAAAFESARLRAGAGMDRATFLDSPYHHLVAARLRLGKLDGAWTAAERAQGRALADLTVAASRRRLSRRDAFHEDSLKNALSDMDARVLALQTALAGDTAGEVARELEEAWADLHEARGAWSSLQRRLTPRHLPGRGPSFSLDQIQPTLDDETALIGWVHVDLAGTSPISAAYVIRRTGAVRWVALPGLDTPDASRQAVNRINRYRDALMTPRSRADREASLWEIAAAGRAVRAQWLAPLLPECENIRNLVVVLSGPLVGVPVESLEDDGGIPVGQRFAVSYVPSATIYAWLKGLDPVLEPGDARRALLVGDPPFADRHLKAMALAEGSNEGANSEELAPASEGPSDGDDAPAYDESYLRSALSGNAASLDCLPRLPWTRVEITRLASLLPNATRLIGPDATEQALLEIARSDRLRKYDTIHLATHALVSDDWPERSALVFSRVGLPDPLAAASRGERVYDGLVTATDVACEFRLAADLVTLSACRTALGRRTPGDGYLGLVSSFLQAGARSLLVSLWRVDDEATALLMTRFYENLIGSRPELRHHPMTKSAALQEAKCWLRCYTDSYGQRCYRHPSCWAGFVLIGDDGRDRPDPGGPGKSVVTPPVATKGDDARSPQPVPRGPQTPRNHVLSPATAEPPRSAPSRTVGTRG